MSVVPQGPACGTERSDNFLVTSAAAQVRDDIVATAYVEHARVELRWEYLDELVVKLVAAVHAVSSTMVLSLTGYAKAGTSGAMSA